jgi:hypothetical protein
MIGAHTAVGRGVVRLVVVPASSMLPQHDRCGATWRRSCAENALESRIWRLPRRPMLVNKPLRHHANLPPMSSA